MMSYFKLSLIIFCCIAIPDAGLCNKPPVFSHVEAYLTLPENLAPGSNVTWLSASDDDDTTLRFSILGAPPSVNFQIRPLEPKSALVVLSSSLDRETIDQFTLTFQVTDGVNQPISQQCLVIVTDINDNPPQFVNLPSKVDLSENSPNGTLVYTVSATDRDTGTVFYELLNEHSVFQVQSVTGNITLVNDLVYIVKRTYVLHVMALDGGGLNATADLTVNILDSRSRPPYFVRLPYSVEVFENASIGTAVIQVSAYDGATGLPGQIVYYIESGDFGFFAINSSSGWMTIRKSINCSIPDIRRRSGLLEIVVKAVSNSSLTNAEVSNWALVTVQLVDVNNHRPTFSQTVYNATIGTNSPPNTLLMFNPKIVVSDMDMGGNGRYVIYLQQNGRSFDVFNVVPDRGEEETAVMIYANNFDLLNFEKTNAVVFQIVAQEYQSVENFSGMATVFVSLVKQNSRALVFSRAEYVVHLNENPQLGQFVVKVTAVVQDSDNNSQRIVYSLIGSEASLFVVNSTTGDIFVSIDAANNSTLLDYEADPVFSIMVEARSNGLQAFAEIIIYLSDKNDNPPVMISSVFYASLQENSASFLFPVLVKATDADITGRIVYSLVTGNFESSFAIDKYTGMVSVRIPVDFESLPRSSGGIINITVMAANEDIPSLNSTALLIVIVEDVNDNAPHFLRSSYLSAIFENSTAGFVAINVTATDADATSPNNLIRYSIISGSLDNFYIDPDRGVITVAPSANFDSFTSQYVLTVQATDRGAGPLTDRCTVNITVIGNNSKPPLFIGGQRFMTTVKDDAAIGTVLVNLSSSYANTRTKLQFQFLNSSFYGVDMNGRTVGDINYLMRLFALESSTGLVIVNSALDAQLAQMISVSIIVMDQNVQTSNGQNNIAYLTVFVQRVRGGMPVFLPSAAPLTVHISETAVPGSFVARLVAVDPYQSPASISYLITNSTDTSAKFEITDSNRLYGVVTVKSSLSPVIAPTISLTITATVVGNANLSSSTMLIVIIDHITGGLQWQFFPADVSILENATVGTSVTRLLAVETSGKIFGEVLYFILTDVMGKFAFENNTGLLVTTGLLNAAVPAYHLLVEARLGSNSIVGDLTIRVQSVNGNKPKFDQQLYAAYTLTNATVGTELMTVRAVDSDSDNLLTYYIDRRSGNASWLFGVDPITGSVFVSSVLTKVIGDLYFTVIANDRGSPPLLGSAVVHVTVIDSNGNRLRIISPPENVTLYIVPNQPVGQFVAQIKSEYVGSENSRLVNYFLVTSFSSDSRFFTIDRQSGVMTTATSINLTSKNAYYVQVQASDVSNVLYSDFRNLTIVVLANDQTIPRFNRIRYPPPIKFSILEGISSVLVASVDIADRSKGDRNAVCYFIVGGTKEWKNRFLLEKFSGNLWLVVSIYQSETNYVDLVVKATNDCWSGYWEMDSNQHREWNISDDSMLLIRVFVLGKDVSQPRFSKQHFIAGILPDVQIEEPVLNLTEYTGQWDSGSKGTPYYTIGKDFRASSSLKAVISSLNRPPFTIGQSDGILRTNSYFQDDWIGSVNFDVYVGISNQFVSDAANVTVYLLSNYQRVKVVFRGTPNDVSAIQEQFTEFLSNVTGTNVGVDAIHVHKSSSGISDPLQTDMFIYAVDPNSHIFDAMSLKNMIDRVYADQKDSFNRFNVTEVETVKDTIAPQQQSLSGTERSIIIAFAIIGTFLILLLFLFCIFMCLCQRKYKRKIKAANAIAAVSGQSGGDMNRLTVPATNAYNSEGSNPAWHENFGGEFYNLSDSDSRNSGDDNSKGQNNSGSQEEFFDNSENSKSKKMHYYKVNGFSDSRPESYNSDQSLNSSDQSRSRRLLPVKQYPSVNGESYANGISTLSRDLMAKSTNV